MLPVGAARARARARARRGRGARGSMRGTRHAARHAGRRKQDAGRRSGTHAVRLPALRYSFQNFSEGNLPPAGATGYLRELSPNAAPLSVEARYHIGTPLEIISTSTLLKRFKSSVVAKLFTKPGMTVTVAVGEERSDNVILCRVATAYLALEQPSKSTARCRMVGAGARRALSRACPRARTAPPA